MGNIRSFFTMSYLLKLFDLYLSKFKKFHNEVWVTFCFPFPVYLITFYFMPLWLSIMDLLFSYSHYEYFVLGFDLVFSFVFALSIIFSGLVYDLTVFSYFDKTIRVFLAQKLELRLSNYPFNSQLYSLYLKFMIHIYFIILYIDVCFRWNVSAIEMLIVSLLILYTYYRVTFDPESVPFNIFDLLFVFTTYPLWLNFVYWYNKFCHHYGIHIYFWDYHIDLLWAWSFTIMLFCYFICEDSRNPRLYYTIILLLIFISTIIFNYLAISPLMEFRIPQGYRELLAFLKFHLVDVPFFGTTFIYLVLYPFYYIFVICFISAIFQFIGSILTWVFGVYFSPIDTVYDLYGFSEPASEKMHIIVEMFHNTFVTLSYVFMVMVAIIGITVYFFISSRNAYPLPVKRRVEYLVDSLFVLIPIIIVYYLTVPAVGYIMHIERDVDFSDTLLNLEIVGHQWYWTYFIHGLDHEYINRLIFILDELHFMDYSYRLEFDQMIDPDALRLYRNFEVNKHLVLPVNEAIRVFVVSDDVIHSWAIPQLGVKVDAIPGRVFCFILKAVKSGVYYGQCSELCGVNHAFMPIVVEFVDMDHFFDWFLTESNGVSKSFFKELLVYWEDLSQELFSSDAIVADISLDRGYVHN